MPTNFATMNEALAQLSSLATFLANMPAGVRAQVEAAVAEGEADLAALQAAVDALAVEVAAGVEGLIPSLAFEATIDPADPNPTQLNGGTFNTIAEAVAASSPGQRVVLNLPGGSAGSVPFTSDIDLKGNRHLVLAGPTNNPAVINHDVKVTSSRNGLRGFRLHDTCTVTTVEVEHTHGALAVPGELFRENASIFTGEAGWIGGVSLSDFAFTGQQTACLVGFNGLACARVAFWRGTLSGVVTAIGRPASVDPFVMAGTQGVQQQNGAVMLSRFTPGSNIVGTV
ncbi:hypothetical protein SAMN05428995_105256 [Loktanella sp. DSM 29012]|uniref:hypothetical protein n=1 Tax=Loktanella sp. DSM 29012 TaxID=1881056 RepID=UPI0008D2C531|nr:hypothetical protein [Loktanella sp. DSM 29012]SEQ59983.1 hypothetical protein SAMN05428995_105256 [Loktanella sp. DSM 29012]